MEKIVVATNKKAFYEYNILEKFEAGIQLKGSEVKSIREGKASLRESYISVRRGEMWLKGAHVSSYSHTGYKGHKPVRDRKLLMNKNEIKRIGSKLAEKGLTAVPTKIYLKQGWIKIEVGIAKGKKLYDKRASKKKLDMERDILRALRGK